VALARATLRDLECAATERGGELRATAEAARQRLEEGKVADEVAVRAEEAARAAVQEMTERLDRCRAALERTGAERAEAEAARDHILKAWSQLEGQKSEVTYLLDGPLRMLCDGGWEDEEVRDSALEAVVKRLRSLHAEAALVAAAPRALTCRPERREAFDELTVASVTEVLRARVDGLDEQLRTKRLERDDAVSEALGLSALSDREVADEAAARAGLLEAKASLQAAIQTRSDTTAELARRGEAVTEQLSVQVVEEERARLLAVALEAAERLVTFDYAHARDGAASPGC